MGIVTGTSQRPRRLRRTDGIRRLVRENRLHESQLVLPAFVREDAREATPIASLPGVVQHSEATWRDQVQLACAAGIGGLMVFGVPTTRDAHGEAACADDSILARAVRWAKAEAGDDLPVIADLCLDEFTTHGHCGVLGPDGDVDNDATLAVYQRMAVTLAAAGSDILGLSGMMDGQVAAVRAALDAAGFTSVVILAYAAKYASAFYGPFREAVDSQLTGHRRGYQQDPANAREAVREVRLDIAEGADIVMVKPAMSYLDIVARVAAEVDVPVAAYQVSGEYAMIEAAARAGMIDRERAHDEALVSIHRAGAQIIATYGALEAAARITGSAPSGMTSPR